MHISCLHVPYWVWCLATFNPTGAHKEHSLGNVDQQLPILLSQTGSCFCYQPAWRQLLEPKNAVDTYTEMTFETICQTFNVQCCNNLLNGMYELVCISFSTEPLIYHLWNKKEYSLCYHAVFFTYWVH